MTAKEFLLEQNDGYSAGDYTNNEVLQLMTDYAELHAVRILKKMCKSELEYQRNINLLNEIKKQ